jgi:hypothetical protein
MSGTLRMVVATEIELLSLDIKFRSHLINRVVIWIFISEVHLLFVTPVL